MGALPTLLLTLGPPLISFLEKLIVTGLQSYRASQDAQAVTEQQLVDAIEKVRGGSANIVAKVDWILAERAKAAAGGA